MTTTSGIHNEQAASTFPQTIFWLTGKLHLWRPAAAAAATDAAAAGSPRRLPAESSIDSRRPFILERARRTRPSVFFTANASN